jgi:hypothetical protein
MSTPEITGSRRRKPPVTSSLRREKCDRVGAVDLRLGMLEPADAFEAGLMRWGLLLDHCDSESGLPGDAPPALGSMVFCEFQMSKIGFY